MNTNNKVILVMLAILLSAGGFALFSVYQGASTADMNDSNIVVQHPTVVPPVNFDAKFDNSKPLTQKQRRTVSANRNSSDPFGFFENDNQLFSSSKGLDGQPIASYYSKSKGKKDEIYSTPASMETSMLYVGGRKSTSPMQGGASGAISAAANGTLTAPFAVPQQPTGNVILIDPGVEDEMILLPVGDGKYVLLGFVLLYLAAIMYRRK